MSGEGVLASTPTPDDERADFVAYLEQRRDNCETMAAKSREFGPAARVMRRQLDVIIGDIRAGMHVGSAGVRARLVTAQAAGEQADG